MNSDWGGAVVDERVGGRGGSSRRWHAFRRQDPSLAMGMLLVWALRYFLTASPTKCVFLHSRWGRLSLWFWREIQASGDPGATALRLVVLPASIILLFTGRPDGPLQLERHRSRDPPPDVLRALHDRAAMSLANAETAIITDNVEMEKFLQSVRAALLRSLVGHARKRLQDKWEHCSLAFLWPACCAAGDRRFLSLSRCALPAASRTLLTVLARLLPGGVAGLSTSRPPAPPIRRPCQSIRPLEHD